MLSIKLRHNHHLKVLIDPVEFRWLIQTFRPSQDSTKRRNISSGRGKQPELQVVFFLLSTCGKEINSHILGCKAASVQLESRWKFFAAKVFHHSPFHDCSLPSEGELFPQNKSNLQYHWSKFWQPVYSHSIQLLANKKRINRPTVRWDCFSSPSSTAVLIKVFPKQTGLMWSQVARLYNLMEIMCKRKPYKPLNRAFE